jgi:hypothetical protein
MNKIKLYLSIVLIMVGTSALANPYNWPVTRVIDGDTVEFNAPFMPDPLSKKSSWCKQKRKGSRVCQGKLSGSIASTVDDVMGHKGGG